MKIAYYEELKCHIEILATFLEPFKNDDITIYNSGDKSDWLNYYKKFYNFTIKNINDFFIEYQQYDKIIIGTSFEMKFFDKLSEDEKKLIHDKCIYISHLKENLDLFPHNKTIILSPVNKVNNDITYTLPLNNCYNEQYYKNKTIIAIVGRFKNNNRDIDDLIKLIETNNNLDFEVRIYARHEKFIPPIIQELAKKYPNNLKIFLRLKTNDMIKHFKQVKFIWPLIKKNSVYHQDRLCGAIPLAYNFNIPCILDFDTFTKYNLNNVIIYRKSICENINKIINMDNITYNNLITNIINEKKMIVNQNNIKILNLITKPNQVISNKIKCNR